MYVCFGPNQHEKLRHTSKKKNKNKLKIKSFSNNKNEKRRLKLISIRGYKGKWGTNHKRIQRKMRYQSISSGHHLKMWYSCVTSVKQHTIFQYIVERKLMRNFWELGWDISMNLLKNTHWRPIICQVVSQAMEECNTYGR